MIGLFNSVYSAGPCLKLAISKALGYGIVVGSSIGKFV